MIVQPAAPAIMTPNAYYSYAAGVSPSGGTSLQIVSSGANANGIFISSGSMNWLEHTSGTFTKYDSRCDINSFYIQSGTSLDFYYLWTTVTYNTIRIQLRAGANVLKDLAIAYGSGSGDLILRLAYRVL